MVKVTVTVGYQMVVRNRIVVVTNKGKCGIRIAGLVIPTRRQISQHE